MPLTVSRPLVMLAATVTLCAACTQNPVTQVQGQVDQSITSAVAQLKGLLKSSTGQALKNYLVLAQDTQTKELTTATVGEDGAFAVDAATGRSYVVNVLDAEAGYQGTLAAAGDGVVTTGVKPGDAGSLVLGSAGQITAADPSRLTLDQAFKAQASGSVGIGFKGVGLLSTAYASFKNVLDQDGDGLPDILDADDDNNGVRDSIQGGGFVPGGSPVYRTVERFGFFTNYPVNMGETGGTNYVITVDIQPKAGYYEKLVEAKLLLGPGYARAARIGNRNTPNGSQEPLAGTWADQGMKLFKYTGSDGVKRIEGFILSSGTVSLRDRMKVGDVYRFLLTYDDGTREILTNTIDTIYATAPDNVKINTKDASVQANTVNLSTAPTISWDLMKDSSGAPLTGLTYAVELTANTSTGTSVGAGRFDLGTDITSFNWATATSSTGLSYNPNYRYNLGIKAQCPGGNATRMNVSVTGLPN